MQSPPQSKTPGSRSWRNTSQDSQPSPGSRLAARWFFTLLAVGLIIWLGFMLWGYTQGDPRTYIAALPLDVKDQGTLPPLAFAREDAEGLSGVVRGEGKQFTLLTIPQESNALERLGTELQFTQATPRPQDFLIVYVAGYGITSENIAYLAASDFQPDAGTGRVSVSGLLAEVKRCPQKQKLVVLDCGRLGADPRLGMLANEFPRLVAQEVADSEDPDLWVLLSNSTLQVTRVDHWIRRSVFGQSLAEGLGGQADLVLKDSPRTGNGDGWVSLRELGIFLKYRIADWYVPQPNEAPSPLFLQGGKGVVSPEDLPPKVALNQPPVKPKTKKSVVAQETETGTKASDNGVAVSAEKKPAESSAEKVATKAPDGKDKVADDAETAKLAREAKEEIAAIHNAWKLRDSLESRKGPGKWSPVDFAPHLWREANGRLLHFEQCCLAGKASRSSNLAGNSNLAQELEPVIKNLQVLGKLLAGAEDVTPGPDDGSASRRLISAWQSFVNEEKVKKDSFDKSPMELANVKSAIREQADAEFKAEYFVRWHQAVSLRNTGEVPPFDLVQSYLTSLENLETLLRGLEGQNFKSENDPDLQEKWQQVVDANERLQSQMKTDRENAFAALVQPAYRWLLEDQIATPLLRADERKLVLEKLLAADGPLPSRPEPEAPLSTRAATASGKQWTELANRAALEQQLVKLLNAEGYSKFTPPGDSPPDPTRNEPWEHYRQIGKNLAQCFDEVPEAFTKLTRETPDSSQAGRLLMLVGSRRANSQLSSLAWYPRLHVRPSKKSAKLKFVGPTQLNLDMKKRQMLELTPIVSGDEPVIEAVIEFKSDLISVRAKSDGKEVVSGERRSFSPDDREPLRWEVIAKSDRGDQVTTLTITKTSQERSDEKVAYIGHFNLPRTNEIDLFVTREGRKQPELSVEKNVVEIRAFPNWETSFQLKLARRTGNVVKVKAKLMAVPPPASDQGWVPGRLYSKEVGLRQDLQNAALENIKEPLFKVLAVSEVVTFQKDDSQVPLKFTSTVPPTTVPAAGGTPPAAAAPEPPDVTNGLLCVLTNEDDPSEQWVKWIQLRPLAPKDFFKPQISFDAATKRVNIDIHPVGPADEVLPPGLGPEKPIVVKWDTNGQIPKAAPQFDEFNYQGPGSEATLFAQVTEDIVKGNGKLVILLDVGDYRRAFVYEMECRGGAVARDIRPLLARVRVNCLESPPKMLIYAANLRPSKPDEKKQVVLLGSNEVVPLKATMGLPLQVQFQVDAPDNAFGPSDKSEFIELGFEEGSAKQKFYSDRQVKTRLKKIGEQGALTLDTKVSDYLVDLNPGTLKNSAVRIKSRIVLPRRTEHEDDKLEDAVSVLLDGSPPTLELLSDKEVTLEIGQRLTTLFAAKDELSGLERVDVRFAPMKTTDWQKVEAKSAVKKVEGQREFVLDTKEYGPGEYRLEAEAFDKVANKSDSVSQTITLIAPPPDKPAGPAKGGKGTIRGFVMVGDLPIKGADVTLLPLGKKVTTKRDGRFQFSDVPEGEYTLEGAGIVSNLTRKGKLEKVHPTPDGQVKEETLELKAP